MFDWTTESISKAKELHDKFGELALDVVDEIIEENEIYARKLTPLLEGRVRLWKTIKQELLNQNK